ncbi:MAG TPA: hypothetical protein VF755_14865 [Catenuloplanes sp.]|jgi:hypothetical protein
MGLEPGTDVATPRRGPRPAMATPTLVSAHIVTAAIAVIGLLGLMTGAAGPVAPEVTGCPAGAPVLPAPATMPDLRTVGLRIEPNVPFDGGKLAVWFARPPAGDGLVVSLGRRDPNGQVAAYGATAVGTPAGSAPQSVRRPAVGFHRPTDAAAGMGRPLAYAVFGIVVGEVDTVSVEVGGRVAEASLATWSEDPQVHVWWALGPPLPGGSSTAAAPLADVTDLVAYGRDGAALFGGPAVGC